MLERYDPVPRMARPNGLRIIVLGYVVRGPVGGIVAYHLNYLLGLVSLGHDVYFLEDSDDYPSCYDPSRQTTDFDPSYGLRFAAASFERAGLGDRWAYYDAHRTQWHGPCGGRVAELCASADLLLDVAGVNPMRPWLTEIPARALIDLDPVFTQIRHLNDSAARRRALQHTSFFTLAENFGTPGCTVPADGLPWQPTRQPLAPGLWHASPPPSNGRFTTVMQWESYAAQEHDGVRYGLKAQSFEPFLDLPARTGDIFELAVGGLPHALEPLRRNGWCLRDPIEVSRDLDRYLDFIRSSAGEFGIAKHAYVVSRSGWFSDRSLAYLANGRPVLVQDTGWSDWLPTGLGVIAFATPDQAATGIDQIRTRPVAHARAAQEMAREYFGADKILPALLEHATSTVGSRT